MLTELKLTFLNLVVRDSHLAQLTIGNKERQRDLLLQRKAEIVAGQQHWLDSHLHLLIDRSKPSLPAGYVPKSLRLVVCKEQWQHDLWRAAKLNFWAMPPNEYVGRRKRILVFDGDFLFGLIGLASCIWGLTARDRHIGWDVSQKTQRINYVVDAYVLGAIPPYNGVYRGSKLLAYLVASAEVREIWLKEYGISPAIVVTTTLFGHSAVLNRVKHQDRTLWRNVGYTRGLGTMHFSLETINLAKALLDEMEIKVPDRLSSGPNWKLRLMRTAIEAVGLRAEEYLVHGYKRGVYMMEYAENAKDFLMGNSEKLTLNQYPMDELLATWQYRNVTQHHISG